MSKPLELQTSGDDLSTLWERLDNLRKGTVAVKVEPDLLKKFLLDHSKLVKFYADNNGQLSP